MHQFLRSERGRCLQLLASLLLFVWVVLLLVLVFWLVCVFCLLSAASELEREVPVLRGAMEWGGSQSVWILNPIWLALVWLVAYCSPSLLVAQPIAPEHPRY